MNYITPEQIKEYVSKNPEGIAGNSKELSEMVNHFAELIIAKCVTVCEEQKEMYAMLNETAGDDPTWAAMTTAVSSCASGIKQHFGVE
jgi:hypothetical protein